MFVFEDNKLYVDIKAYAELLGYETYNGDYKSGKYSEDKNNCYITNQNEIASFTFFSLQSIISEFNISIIIYSSSLF